MLPVAMRNNRPGSGGFSLVEVLIALVILLFVFMGLLHATLLTIDTNITNELRNEGVRVVSDRVAQLRSLPFGDVRLADTGDAVTFAPDDDPGTPEREDWVDRRFRSMENPIRFTMEKIIDDIDTNTKNATIRATWVYRGDSFNHRVTATVKR